jgi:hypothetical protein
MHLSLLHASSIVNIEDKSKIVKKDEERKLMIGCRARIRTLANGFKVRCATVTQLGNQPVLPKVGVEPT